MSHSTDRKHKNDGFDQLISSLPSVSENEGRGCGHGVLVLPKVLEF